MSRATHRTPSLDCIILSAGESRRLGQPKQHVVISGQSLLERSVNLARRFNEVLQSDRKPILISGAFLQQDCMALLAMNATKRVRHHHNYRWESGMGSSMACARQLSDAEGVLVLLVDQYKVEPDDLLNLHAHWQEEPERPVAARYANTLGPPVIWPRHLWSSQSLAEGSQSLLGKPVLMQHDPHYVDIPNAKADLDTAQHLNRALEES